MQKKDHVQKATAFKFKCHKFRMSVCTEWYSNAEVTEILPWSTVWIFASPQDYGIRFGDPISRKCISIYLKIIFSFTDLYQR